MNQSMCNESHPEGLQQGHPPSQICQGSTFAADHRRGTRRKYIWRPDYDAYLKAQYFGGLNRRFRVLNRMIRLTGLPRWYIKRQAARLGLTMHMDRKPWIRAELDVLDDLTGNVSAAMIAKRLRRPLSSVVNKIKRLHLSRRVRNGYTMRDLELCLGEDHHKISAWVTKGWLQDHLQRTRRHDGNGNDIHRFREKEILNFLSNHPQEINLGKVDQVWFLDLVLLKGRELHQETRGGLRRQPETVWEDRPLRRAHNHLKVSLATQETHRRQRNE